jgi:hypothetical protein
MLVNRKVDGGKEIIHPEWVIAGQSKSEVWNVNAHSFNMPFLRRTKI